MWTGQDVFSGIGASTLNHLRPSWGSALEGGSLHPKNRWMLCRLSGTSPICERQATLRQVFLEEQAQEIDK